MSVLTDIPMDLVFNDLSDHMKEDGMLDSHVITLIKSVIRSFIKIQMHHIAKQSNEKIVSNARVRKKYNKLVLFKNQ